MSLSSSLSQPWLAVVSVLAVAIGAASLYVALPAPPEIRLVAASSVAATIAALLLWRFERARHAAERRVLSQSEARSRALLESVDDVVMLILDSDGTILYLSPSTERLLGYKEDELQGEKLVDLVSENDYSRVRWLLSETLREPSRTLRTELHTENTNGLAPHFEVVASNQLDNPSINGILLVCRDVTIRKAQETQLIIQALHDPLTHLPNRAMFMECLSHALDRGARGPGSVAVLFLDLDDFKVINDTLGHEAGDSVLVGVADRLKAAVRPGDTVARLGGDEFTILLENITHLDDVIGTARRIQERVRAPFHIAGREARVTTSIGIALNTHGFSQAEDLLRNADVAMYESKTRYKGHYTIFESSMNWRVHERVDMEADLRRALDHSEFQVYYQPIVDLETGMLNEVEALVRWQHPQRGLLTPAQFIPLAEQTGLIRPLGRWVLAEACRRVRIWQAQYPSDPQLKLSVNLSAGQLQDGTLATEIAGVLRNTQFNPRHLILEIPESIALSDVQAMGKRLGELKRLGVQLAIDNFGAGHSAFASLRQFPLDALKLDRPFVAKMGAGPENTAVLDGVFGIARILKLKVAAEGIESAEQLAQLQARRCALGQGFYFSEPLPAGDLTALLALRQHQSGLAWVGPRDIFSEITKHHVAFEPRNRN